VGTAVRALAVFAPVTSRGTDKVESRCKVELTEIEYVLVVLAAGARSNGVGGTTAIDDAVSVMVVASTPATTIPSVTTAIEERTSIGSITAEVAPEAKRKCRSKISSLVHGWCERACVFLAHIKCNFSALIVLVYLLL
jgi:hypothetical protein